MDISDYQKRTRDTAKKFDTLDDEVVCWALCTGGEVGELQNLIKKAVYHQHTISHEQIVAELGDIMWYLTRLADALGIDMDVVLAHNLNKLAVRYPKGFDPERSIYRDTSSE